MSSIVPYPRSLILAVLPVVFTLHRLLRSAPRLSKIPAHSERVLILGASSGVGRSVAHLYANRGARVCVIGRRADKLDEVVKECREKYLGGNEIGGQTNVVGVVADFSNVDDMVRVRGKLESGKVSSHSRKGELNVSFG
jgi:NAD(P)-dependent dehydrogenase (short-subunit alcohol dehydrogenase family)